MNRWKSESAIVEELDDRVVLRPLRADPAGLRGRYQAGCPTPRRSGVRRCKPKPARIQTEDGSGQVSIGRQIAPEPYPTPGEQVVGGDRQFTLVEDTRETRVLEEIEGDIRLEVVSQTLDSETLLRIAESVVYDPERDK
jgi:hypothetical protein